MDQWAEGDDAIGEGRGLLGLHLSVLLWSRTALQSLERGGGSLSGKDSGHDDVLFYVDVAVSFNARVNTVALADPHRPYHRTNDRGRRT